jgi:uncharacterized membrane protein
MRVEGLSSQSALAEKGRSGRKRNISEVERMISLAGGATLALLGMLSGRKTGIGLGVLGAGLVYRGASGHCDLYNALGINTAGPHNPGASLVGNYSIKVEKSTTIQRSPEELFRFWRDLPNLPRFMKHLKSVTVTGDRTSHWVAQGPAGHDVEWDAEIINEHENELIAWKSIEGSEVDNAGSVRFAKDPSGRGTFVRVSLMYHPPAGKLGALVARLFGEDPHLQIQEDLRRFKQLMEAGEIATTEGQSSGRKAVL